MEQLYFYVYSKNNDFSIGIDNNSQKAFSSYLELVSIFWEIANHTLHINPIVKMNTTIRNQYNSYVLKYKDKNAKIYRLKQNLDGIKDGEYFFTTNKMKYSPEDIVFIGTLVDIYNQTEDEEERANLFFAYSNKNNELFGNLFSKYDVLAFDSSNRQFVGEHDKNKRICRFCNKSMFTIEKVTFDEKAHAIPEALGNKGLVANEECDICNDKFGKTIEKDLISFLDVYRVFYGVSGKNGIPKLIYDNKTTMHHTKNLKEKLSEALDSDNMTVISSQDIKFDETNKVLSIQLKSLNDLIEVGIYKAFCKIAISLVNTNELQYLQKTIEWIKECDEKSYILPKVANLISNDMYVDVPFLTLYIKKDDDKLPHLVGEFKFKSLIYVFIVPFSKKNKITFTKEKDYNYFWEFFKQYSSANNWTFYNFSSSVSKKYIFDLNFKSLN